MHTIALKPKIIVVAAHPLTINTFLRALTLRISQWAEIYIIANFNEDDFIHSDIRNNASIICVPIQRIISPRLDIYALVQILYWIIRIRPACVISATPKAGFIAQLASFILMVRTRLHIFTGQVWANKNGFSKFFLKSIDALTGKFTTMNLVDGNAQQKFLVNQRVLSYKKSRVTGYGSVSGVDTSRFKFNSKFRNDLRSKYNIPESSKVIIYLGRLDSDKGIMDLVNAFSTYVLPKHPDTFLFIVGFPEDYSLISSLLFAKVDLGLHLQLIGPTRDPEKYMSFADIFCLPSYREGLNVTLLEAAACELLCISTDIYGTHDALIDESTGLKYQPGSVIDLGSQINRLISDTSLSKKLKANAFSRVKRLYDSNVVSELFSRFIFENVCDVDSAHENNKYL